MQVRDRYPVDAVTGGCIITGDYSTNEPIVDLDLDVEVLPPFGRICISAKGVRLMCRALDWDIDPDLPEQRDALQAQVDDLEAENRDLRSKLQAIADIFKVSQIMSVVDAGSLIEASS